jgi:hypothetical protein
MIFQLEHIKTFIYSGLSIDQKGKESSGPIFGSCWCHEFIDQGSLTMSLLSWSAELCRGWGLTWCPTDGWISSLPCWPSTLDSEFQTWRSIENPSESPESIVCWYPESPVNTQCAQWVCDIGWDPHILQLTILYARLRAETNHGDMNSKVQQEHTEPISWPSYPSNPL